MKTPSNKSLGHFAVLSKTVFHIVVDTIGTDAFHAVVSMGGGARET